MTGTNNNQLRKMRPCAHRLVAALCIIILFETGIANPAAAIERFQSGPSSVTPNASSKSWRIAQTTGSTHGQCPKGYRGRYPDCRPPKPPKKKCPRGTIGKHPFCVSVKVQPKRPCPRGYRGWQPNCRKIITEPRPCPRGYRGKRPNCKRIVTKPPKKYCKSGTYGKWPNCKRRKKPTVKTVKPRKPKSTRPIRKTRRKVRQPTRRAVASTSDHRPNELVVVLDRSVDQNAAFSIAQQYRLVRVSGRDINLINARVQRYRIPDRRSITDVLEEMNGDARIRGSQPNYIYRLLGDKHNATQPAKRAAKAKHQYALTKLNIAQSHAITTGRDIRIAVIDSGVDQTHPEFNNANSKSYNAVPHSPFKTDSHGTSVAGVIGARGDLVGIAPDSQLLTIRAFTRERRKAKPITDSYVLVHALDWAHTNKARIYNLSFAGPHDPLIEEMIASVHRAGAITVAAAGNNGPKAKAAYPAAYPDVIAVTATDKRDRHYKKSNRGDHIAIAAPGVSIFAPVPEGGYDFKSGTSFAAPHVSGLIALILERKPNLTSSKIRDILISSAIDLGAPGTDRLYGAGRIDALASLQAALTVTSPALAGTITDQDTSLRKTGTE